MNRLKKNDLISLLLMIGIPVPCFLFYTFRFYTGFDHSNIIGQNVCLIIAVAFLWGMADIVRHYLSIAKEHDHLENFRKQFSEESNTDLSDKAKGSIINHRYKIIISLRQSLSDIKHEALTEIINSRESSRAIIAKYFIGACVMLGLLGSFLGLLETVGGAYSAIEKISDSTQLLTSLHSPLSGMSLTFTTSIVGIIASLSLGFAFIFLNRRQVTFLADLEEFTQTALIPGLSTSSGKRIEDLLERLIKIEENTASFTKMRHEIEKNAKVMFSSMDNYYSRLSVSVQDGLNSTMLSIKENVSGSFNSLTGSTALSIKELGSTIGSSVKDLSTNVHSEIKGFVADEKQMFQDLVDEMNGNHREEVDSSRLLQERVSQDIRHFLESEKAMIQEMTANIASAQEDAVKTTSTLYNEMSDSIKDFLLKERAMITEMLDRVNLSSESSMKASQVVLRDYSDRNREQMEGFLTTIMDSYQTSVDAFMDKWSRIFKEQVNFSTSEIQENTALVYKDALNKNESIITQNMELFKDTSEELRGLGSELKDMHGVYEERLGQTTQAVNDAVQGFRIMFEQEKHTNENLAEKSIKAGELLEEVAVLLHSNQAEMNASLAMFVQGVDNLLQAFQMKSTEKEEEQATVLNLEKTLNDLTEKSGNVLHEYVARSREIYSGLLDNQLHLTRKIEEIANGGKS